MAQVLEQTRQIIPTEAEAFAPLDLVYARYPLQAADRKRFGAYRLGHSAIIETPESVASRGEILTNPSQIIRQKIGRRGSQTNLDFAYFRQEPLSNHLGKTRSVPYQIVCDNRGRYSLQEFDGAMTIIGEDPRVMHGVRMRSGMGKVHSGVCVSTVHASLDPTLGPNSARIKQVFYWGIALNSLEPVLEIPDLKNTCVYPIGAGDDDTSLAVFGRPHPDISYHRVDNLEAINHELIVNSPRITAGFLPDGARTGVNYIKGSKDLGYLELDIHEAFQEMSDGGKIMYYRLGRYGFQLPTKANPDGRLIPLGVIARRSQFPEAAPKPADQSVADYTHILYGSMGDPEIGYMVTGVSDRHIGVAQIIRTA